MRRAFLLALGLSATEPLKPRQGQAADAGTGEGHRDSAANMGSEVADLLDEFLIDGEWHHRSHRRLLPVIAGWSPRAILLRACLPPWCGEPGQG